MFSRIPSVARTVLLPLTALAAGVVSAAPALACIHADAEDPQPPYLDAIEVGVHFDGSVEVLTFAPAIGVDGGSTRVAMVTATPSLPSNFSVGEARMFADLRTLLTPQAGGEDAGTRGDASFGDESDGPNGLEIYPPVQVGPYTFHAFQINGDGGLQALNDQLSADGFVPLDPSLAQVYVDEGWFFIAVTADATDASLADGILPPLQMIFSTTEAVVPLRLEAGMPPFEINIYAATREPVDEDQLATYGASIREHLELPASELGEVLCHLRATAPIDVDGCVAGLDSTPWHLTWITGDGPLNTPAAPISAWTSEFKLKGDAAPVEDTSDDTSGDTTGGGGSGNVTTQPGKGCAAASGSAGSGTLALAGLLALVSRRRRAAHKTSTNR